jgi:predicted GIY-YIG superfamily endonuclease
MKNRFKRIMLDVGRKYEQLISSQLFKLSDVPKEYSQKSGIYLFSENNKPLYVGRTNNLKKRLCNHIRSSHNTATFAFLLARYATERISASYRPSGSRKDLLKNDTTFRQAFDDARERIRRMDVRFVEEKEPVGQALLEIYAAYVSKAKYNDFDTH